MANNFNSFKPYNAGSDLYSSIIYLSAEDRLEEILVDLRAINCSGDADIASPWDWDDLSLAGFKKVEMHVKKEGEDDIYMTVVGVPMQPLEDGKVIFRLGGSSFEREVGRYVGLIEVTYKGTSDSGYKIVTARNYIPFEVREDFYYDPFQDDGTSIPTVPGGSV